MPETTDIRPETALHDVAELIDRYSSEGHSFRSDPIAYRLLHHIERYWFVADAINQQPTDSPVKVIDMGCGNGVGLDQLAARSSLSLDMTGVEMDPEACNKAAESGSIRMINCGIEDLDLTEQYDVVICFEVIGFSTLSSDANLLSVLKSYCAPGGTIFLSIPNYRDRAKKRYFDRTYSLDEFRELLVSNFPNSSDIKMMGQLYPTNRQSPKDVGVQALEDLSSTPDFCIGVVKCP